MPRAARTGPASPDKPLLQRACGADNVGARAVDDAVPERGLRPNADEAGPRAGQYVVA